MKTPAPANIVKFLATPFLNKICERLLLKKKNTADHHLTQIIWVNPFNVTGLFLYPLKTSEKPLF